MDDWQDVREKGGITILGYHISVVKIQPAKRSIVGNVFKPKSPVRSNRGKHIPITEKIVVPWQKPVPWGR
jgi:hypothetical protein